MSSMRDTNATIAYRQILEGASTPVHEEYGMCGGVRDMVHEPIDKFATLLSLYCGGCQARSKAQGLGPCLSGVRGFESRLPHYVETGYRHITVMASHSIGNM